VTWRALWSRWWRWSLRPGLRTWSGWWRRAPYARAVFEDKHTPEEVTEYEVAREILGRRLGQALAAADASDDPVERERCEADG